MKAISIRQPWAWAICNAGKRIENRGWQHAPSYRGPLLIHASAGCTGAEWVDGAMAIRGIVSRPVPPALKALPRGALVARANLIDVVWNGLTGHRWPIAGGCCSRCGADNAPPNEPCDAPDPWAVPGALGLILADVVPLPLPIPWKGALGLFDVPILNRGSRAQIAGVREEDLGFGEPAEETLR